MSDTVAGSWLRPSNRSASGTYSGLLPIRLICSPTPSGTARLNGSGSAMKKRGARGRGPSKATGRLGVCCGSTGPGSTHLVAGLYKASRDHAPVLAISGEMPRRCGARNIFKRPIRTCCSVTSRSIPRPFPPAQAPAVIHQAIAAAYAGRGVAHLTLPVDVMLAKAEGGVSASPRSSREPKPSPAKQILPRWLAASTRPAAS